MVVLQPAQCLLEEGLLEIDALVPDAEEVRRAGGEVVAQISDRSAAARTGSVRGDAERRNVDGEIVGVGDAVDREGAVERHAIEGGRAGDIEERVLGEAVICQRNAYSGRAVDGGERIGAERADCLGVVPVGLDVNSSPCAGCAS